MTITFSKDVAEYINFVSQKAGQDGADFDSDHIRDTILKCGITSPIEQLFVAALYLESHRNRQQRVVMFSPQFRECGYVVDFMIVADGKTGLVELDGFAFHDATKEMATRDKKRDRELMREGWIVIRFSGQEVSNSPAMCAKEAIDIISARGRTEWP